MCSGASHHHGSSGLQSRLHSGSTGSVARVLGGPELSATRAAWGPTPWAMVSISRPTKRPSTGCIHRRYVYLALSQPNWLSCVCVCGQYNNPSHPPQDSTLALPAGDWALHPVDFWNRQILTASTTLKSTGAAVQLSGAMLTFDKLTTQDTLAPCGRSSASCCAKDAHACTPYTALLVKM